MTPMRILSLSSSCNSIEIDSNISSWNIVKSSVVLKIMSFVMYIATPPPVLVFLFLVMKL